MFDGNAQALDHILVNRLALPRVTRMAYARSNADFPESLRGDATRPERLSDHDAAIVYVALPSAPVVTLNGESPLDVEAFTTFTDPGAVAHDDLGPIAVTVSGTVDVNTPGEYILTYTATNGYATTTVTRLVRVQDTIAPAISGFRRHPGDPLSAQSPNGQRLGALPGLGCERHTHAAPCRSAAMSRSTDRGTARPSPTGSSSTTITCSCAPSGAAAERAAFTP